MPNIPEGAKVPDDHRAAQDDPTEVDQIKVTVRGIDLIIAADTLDDYELLADLGRIDDGDVTRSGPLLRRFVGPDAFRELMDACRDPKTGRVPIDAGVELFRELFAAIEAQGNS